jgi:hypothetical protein
VAQRKWRDGAMMEEIASAARRPRNDVAMREGFAWRTGRP